MTTLLRNVRAFWRWLRSDPRALCLAALRHGPAYGNEVYDRICAGGDSILFSTMYVTLHSLERDGYLTSWEEPAEPGTRGGRPRRYYKINEEMSA